MFFSIIPTIAVHPEIIVGHPDNRHFWASFRHLRTLFKFVKIRYIRTYDTYICVYMYFLVVHYITDKVKVPYMEYALLGGVKLGEGNINHLMTSAHNIKHPPPPKIQFVLLRNVGFSGLTVCHALLPYAFGTPTQWWKLKASRARTPPSPRPKE